MYSKVHLPARCGEKAEKTVLSARLSKGVFMAKPDITKYATVAIVLLVSGAISFAQTQSSSAGLQVNPAQVQKKAATPPPASGTTKTSSVGQNVKVATPADSESWAEQIDVDGNGTAEQTNLVWDSADKVLFSDSAGTFTCSNGSTGTGELLVAVNGAGNKRGRPVGSGFWVASMDKGQCGVPAGTMWGCKFDATGTATACGVATVDQQNNDVILVTSQK
jgi:hypothetical protein